jgi:hypothetical protein
MKPIVMKPETIARRAAERKTDRAEKRAAFESNFHAAKLEHGFAGELPADTDVCSGWFALAGREEEVLVTANGYCVI